jgi:hypothetical protein
MRWSPISTTQPPRSFSSFTGSAACNSEMRLPKLRRGQRNSTSADVTTAVRQLVLIANDNLIAGILNRNGLTTGNGNRWTRERVTSMRSNYRSPGVQAHRRDRAMAQPFDEDFVGGLAPAGRSRA